MEIKRKTIEEFRKQYPRSRGFYNNSDGLIGFNANGFYWWYRLMEDGYTLVGSTQTKASSTFVSFHKYYEKQRKENNNEVSSISRW